MAALKFESQFLVIYAEEMKHGSMQVMHADRILGYVVAKIICFPKGHAAFDTTARHPNAEATGMVVAAVILGLHLALIVDSTSKFSAPNH